MKNKRPSNGGPFVFIVVSAMLWASSVPKIAFAYVDHIGPRPSPFEAEDTTDSIPTPEPNRDEQVPQEAPGIAPIPEAAQETPNNHTVFGAQTPKDSGADITYNLRRGLDGSRTGNIPGTTNTSPGDMTSNPNGTSSRPVLGGN